MRRKNMLRSLSLSLAALLLTTPVWAQENSAADVVENQTMTIGGKEQIVTKAALEKAQKAQKGKGKDKGGLVKRGKRQFIICIISHLKIFPILAIKVLLKNSRLKLVMLNSRKSQTSCKQTGS